MTLPAVQYGAPQMRSARFSSSQVSPRGRFASLAFSVLVPVWLLGLIFPPVIATDNLEYLQFVSLFWLFPIAIVASREYFLVPSVYRRQSAIRTWTLLFLLSAATSGLVSVQPARSMAHLVATGAGLIYCAGLWHCLKNRMELCLSVYAVMGSLLVGWVYLAAPLHNGRLSWNDTSQPNHLAIVAYGILIASLAVRPKWLSRTLVVVNLIVIVATEGRGSLLASLITIGVYAALNELNAKNRRGALRVVALSLLALSMYLMFQEQVVDAVEHTLLLNDPRRGLSSGFTGRVESWNGLFDLFLAHPILGVGYRADDMYGSAHSGYLALLAEVGIVGTACGLMLIGSAILRLLKLGGNGDRFAALGISAVAGYLFLAVFERLFINTGLPTSMLVWLLLLMPHRRVTSCAVARDICKRVKVVTAAP